MDFLNNVWDGIKNLFSGIGNFFSGGSGFMSPGPMMAPPPMSNNYGYDFGGPQMRPSFGMQPQGFGGSPFRQSYDQAATFGGVYPYAGGGRPMMTAGMTPGEYQLARETNRLGRTIENLPTAIGVGIINGAAGALNKEIRLAETGMRADQQRWLMSHRFGR